MGAQVERVPGSPAVAGAFGRHARSQHFGGWFRRQRELRGISIWYVAARTKLPPERIQQIEDATRPLAPDGHGRALARTLALAIGADPADALERLAPAASRKARRARSPHGLRPGRVLRGLLLGTTVALGLGLLGYWLESRGVTEGSPRLVLRPDYLERLLGGDGS
ncbi:MAG: helix-turn-helix domain-containing protein [Myxococcota bacterium]